MGKSIETAGYRLKKARKNLNWSQEKLGKAVGVTKQQVKKWEDAGDNLKIVTVVMLCDAMGVDPRTVLTPVVRHGQPKDVKNSAMRYNLPTVKENDTGDNMSDRERELYERLLESQKEITRLKIQVAELETGNQEKPLSQGRQKKVK